MTLNIFDQKSPSGKGTVELPLEPRSFTGTTDIDDSAQTETTQWLLLTIEAPAAAGMMDVEVWFDLDLATTGFGTVESSATILFAVARKVDGTNYRLGADANTVTTAISGTNAAAERAAVVRVGDIPAGETVQIFADMSADATSDIELPYKGVYKSRGTATVTAVAAA
jgi:hypothetical protein